MAITEQLKNLVEQLPDAAGNGMYTGNMDKETIDTTIAAIAKGGKENLLGLIEMLGEPGTEDNVKPHYALHCTVNYALITQDEKLRKDFCEALGAQLQNKGLHPYNRACLCQELQWAGRDEACAALGSVLLDDDVTDAAATALAAIGGERAAAQLRTAAERAKGKARLNLIDALAALVEPKSAGTFTKALDDSNREVRIAAALGLANLGSVDVIEPLFKAADGSKGWERTQLTKACLVLGEKLAAGGDRTSAKRIYERLQKTRTSDNEAHVRDAAALGLAAIG